MGDLDLSEFMTDAKRGGRPCWYVRIDATDEQREKLDAAMALDNIPNRKIAEVLASWGFAECGPGAVGSHRAGRCACD